MKENEKRLYMLRYASGRLYRINTTQSDTPTALYFSTKEKAKRKRDTLNALSAGETLVVSIGPDHKRYRTGTTA